MLESVFRNLGSQSGGITTGFSVRLSFAELRHKPPPASAHSTVCLPASA